MIRGRTSPLLGLVVTALVAVPSAAFVLQRTLDPPAHEMALTAASGALSIVNSREGEAVLTAASMVPGAASTGTVALRNTGDGPETLTLDAGDPVDHAGPGGGVLSQRLTLRVEDVTGSTPAVVYAGALTGLSVTDLGTLAKDEQRTYRFVVSFPDGGAGGADNAFQGSSASIGFDWSIAAAAEAPAADAPLEQQVLFDGPTSYWPLEDSGPTMDDVVGANAGQLTGTAPASGAAPGGGASAFDGVGSYGSVDAMAAPAGAYTMEAWVDPASTGDTVILEHAPAGTMAIAGGHFVFGPTGAAGPSSVAASSAAALRSGASVATGRWQLVVVTWDAASGTGRLYVDGQLADQEAIAGAPSGSATFYVGRGATGGYFQGAIAQVAYYPIALSADRILAHWNAGHVAAAPTPSPTPNPAPSAAGGSGSGGSGAAGSGSGSGGPAADPGSGAPAEPRASAGEPPAAAPGPPAPAGDAPSSTDPASPSSDPAAAPGGDGAACPSTAPSSMWAVLNARAAARAKARARLLAKARARRAAAARAKARGKTAATPRKKRAPARAKKAPPKKKPHAKPKPKPKPAACAATSARRTTGSG